MVDDTVFLVNRCRFCDAMFRRNKLFSPIEEDDRCFECAVHQRIGYIENPKVMFRGPSFVFARQGTAERFELLVWSPNDMRWYVLTVTGRVEVHPATVEFHRVADNRPVLTERVALLPDHAVPVI